MMSLWFKARVIVLQSGCRKKKKKMSLLLNSKPIHRPVEVPPGQDAGGQKSNGRMGRTPL